MNSSGVSGGVCGVTLVRFPNDDHSPRGQHGEPGAAPGLDSGVVRHEAPQLLPRMLLSGEMNFDPFGNV